MSASSRFGYSMLTGALVSGALVEWESARRHAQITAGAAAHHVSEGAVRLSTWAVLAVAIGLVLFAAAAAVSVRSRPRRVARQAAAARPRGYGGYR